MGGFMKVEKRKTEFGTNISFIEGNDTLIMSFGGNLDFYMAIRSKEAGDSHEFTITKENYYVYSLFERLYNDIRNINLPHMNDEHIPYYVETDEDLKEYLKEREEKIEETKKNYRECNLSHYNDLYNSETDTITWYSDETSYKVSNYVTINKIDDTFKLNFSIQEYIEGYNYDFHTPHYIAVRFSNSGSLYEPFNDLFMKLYIDMCKTDDINDYGHQMNIEEYLYNIILKITPD